MGIGICDYGKCGNWDWKNLGFGIWDRAPLLGLKLLPELFQLQFQLGIPAVPGSLLPLGSGQPVLQLLVLGKIPKNPPDPGALPGFAKFLNGEEFQEFFAGFQESGRWGKVGILGLVCEEKWEFCTGKVGILLEYCRKSTLGEGREPQKLGLGIKGKAGKNQE